MVSGDTIQTVQLKILLALLTLTQYIICPSIIPSITQFCNLNIMLKTRKSPPKKEMNKTSSQATLLKKNKSKEALKPKNKPMEKSRDKSRDDLEQTKLKKRIESMETPQLLLKIHYKGKKLSVPVSTLETKSLKELVEPFISRFQLEILRNSNFDPASILNWKTIITPSILKDYYFQLNLPMSPFKGEMIDIEPIFRARASKMLQLRDFQVLKCIGTGGFSKVFLARKKSTGKFYALKLMEKEGLSESGKECVITNERDIMADLNHPRILSMEAAFQTHGFIVFVLEYCPGGELFYHLRKVRRMNEEDARFCFVEILTAFQYLHSNGIVYRDVKPENILIDADGHLKLADFGLSRVGLGKDELAFTYCGSPQYMAPQMLSKSGHNFPVDYYCLGALLYELVTGNPPFYSREVEKIYYAIEHQEIDFPEKIPFSPELQMLLSGLLMKDPRRRLGSLGGIRQILSHPWCRKLKASDVLQGKVPTPIKINLMAFNINQEEIGEAEKEFQKKLREQQHVSSSFEPMFDDFYFSKDEPMNILSEVDASPKLGVSTSKMNLTIKKSPKSKQKQREQSKSKSRDLGSRQKKLRKMKSSKRLINQSEALIQRGKKRLQPSHSKKEIKKREKLLSPKPNDREIKMLKRVKSTDTLGRLLR